MMAREGPGRAVWTAVLLIACATPASAQIGGLGAPNLQGAVGSVTGLIPPLGAVGDELGRTAGGVLAAPARLTALLRGAHGALVPDAQGWPVVAGQIVAMDLSPAGRAAATRAGFTVIGEERYEALDLAVTLLAPPPDLSLDRAAERLRILDPAAGITLNHVHAPAGETGAPAPVQNGSGARLPAPRGPGAALGLIDTGVDAAHPAFAGVPLRQQGFGGAVIPAAHGTAVASLLVGRSGAFAGADAGASLVVADIYGGRAAGGAATALAQALAWMVAQGVRVVNVSLVGPRNALVERAVARAQARGVVIVAAVGNEGPAAPPLYPAAYDGVVGVSGVARGGRVLPESGRGPQVDFAAPGADMAAAAPGGRWTSVRGSSFAAPIVAGLIARQGGDAGALETLANAARDLGPRGRDPAYGRGLVGETLAVAPAAVAARGRLEH